METILRVTRIIKAENFSQAEDLDFECTVNGTEVVYAIDYGDGTYAVYNTLHGERDNGLTLDDIQHYEE